MGASVLKKWLLLTCLLLATGGIMHAQDFKKMDSLQKIADAYSRAGRNYKAAFEQDHVDLLLMNADAELRGNSLYRLAQAYIKSRQYDLAFYNITMALERKSETADSIGIAHCYSVMGQVYLYKKDFKQAGLYNRKALAVLKRNAAQKATAATAKVLYANFYIEQKKYAEALKQLTEALAATPGTGFYNSKAYINDKIGLCHLKLGNMAMAMQHFRTAQADERSNPYVDIRMAVLRHLGELYLSQKEYAAAFASLEQCLQLKPEAEESEEYVLANETMARLHEVQGNYEEAYNYGMEAVQAKRGLTDATLLTGTEARSVKFDAEQLAIQNRLIEASAETQRIEAQQADSKKNAYLFFFIFAIIVLATVLVFLYFYLRQKKAIATNRNNELKQKLLLTQMNPHFIFNSVDTIQSLIYEDKNEEAVDYLSKFSQLTLQILENSSLQYISLKEEISMTANYLVIQQLLYNNNFEFDIKADEGIDPETWHIPPMLAQPFIENAIKHGIAGKKEGGMIRVKFYKRGRSLIFEVTDNGRGLTNTKRAGHKSMATQITAERLNAGPDAIEVSSIMENGVAKGAVSRFAIPYKIKSKPA